MRFCCFIKVFACLLCVSASLGAQWAYNDYEGDVPYVPTPPEVVDAMLELADLKAGDILYDLGSGDGRIVITAAQRYGVKGIGIDISPDLIEEARANAKEAGVAGKVRFQQGNFFEADISEASVVTLYLLSTINLKLKPKLLKELKPGTRVVSHRFSMGTWKPEIEILAGGRPVYLFVVPEREEAGSGR